MAASGPRSGTMELTNDVEPVTVLKRSAAELIARATDRHSPIVITQNGRASRDAVSSRSTVCWTRTAVGDLLGVVDNVIDRNGAAVAHQLAQLVTREVVTFATMPLRSRVVPELEAEGIDGEPRAAREPLPNRVRPA